MLWQNQSQSTTYVDPGATARDNVDGNITSKLTSYGIGAVKTTAPTSSSSPYYVTYGVSDSSGNAALQGLREVVVACKSPEVKCTASDGTLFCSTSSGLCIQSTTTTATNAGTYPTIKLIGQAVLGLTQGISYRACPTLQPTNVICDRGCSAADNSDGVLTPYVQACSISTAEYLFKTTGIRACSYNMKAAGVYTITFTVTNSQGLSASVNRILVVEPVCPYGETLCSNKIACSSSGVCLGTTARVLTTVTAPVITLVTSTYLSSVVQVKQGHSYQACSTGQSPTSAVLCELGASAISASDGNLTSVVLACPPTACLGTACPGYRFVEQGISSCAVNTSAAVGTTFAVTFLVFDYSIPSFNASVTRTISIINPCGTGQYLCSDNTCSDVLCGTRDALSAGPPGLEFVAYGNSTSVTTGYGVDAAVPLVPCTRANNATGCGAVALDSTGADISSSIVVVDVTPCAIGHVCPACAITFAAAGLCQPGAYLYLYRAKDSYAQLASAWRLVQVQQQYAVTLTLPLTLSAANLTDAQAQADVLTATSNATDALESALAAGLISEYTSAPNLTAAAAAQNLTWAPISVSAITVDSYDLAMSTSDSALLTLSLSANLGVSGNISDVAPDTGISRRRHLLQTASGLLMNSSLVSSSLGSALSLNVTAVNSSTTNGTNGAQLTNYTLTTAAVDDDTAVLSGLLANLTCIQAELYEMEAALSVGEDPLWVVPYTTVAKDFQDLLNDYTTYMTHTQKQLNTIYSSFVKAIAAILGTGDSTVAALSSTASTSASTLTTASGCARDTDGDLKAQFYVSAHNITREIGGLLSGGRRLQSTPCSSTAGTTLALNYTANAVEMAAHSTKAYTNSNASDPVYASQQLSRLIGWTGNQVVAGVLLQTTRRLVTHSCKQRFDKFTTVCTEQQVVYDEGTGQAVVVPKSSGGSAPYGVDAVFLADSSAYDDTAVVGDFYNTSASSGEITPYVGTPYGFHPRAMSGFSLGFPVVFDNRLSHNASQRLFAILTDGNYLDGDTATVTVRLLTFNVELQVYGYARIDFTWGLAGLINVVARFVAIPDITLKSSSSSIDQTVLAAFVLLVLLTAAQAGLLIYSVFCGTRASTSVWTMIQATLGETWVLYDAAVLASMLICLITYSVYIQSVVDFQPQDTYEVYDSLGGAQARLLLPKKNNPSTYNVSAPSTWAEVPGGAGRWTLPDVDTGLNSMADMYNVADSMATKITLYTTLQGITMQLLILRLIRVLSAQKRLSILTTTAVKVMPWILDVGYTVMFVALMLAMMGHILFGDFEVTMFTLPDSISGYFEVMFTQQVANYNQDLGLTTTGPMQMDWLLRSEAYAWYFLPPITSVLILWWFLRGIIVSSFRQEAKAQSSVVGMHNDLAVLFKELTQNLAGAPSNALLVGLFQEAAPRRLKTNVWARLRGQKEQLTIQERQRQGIVGIHMESLDEHLDQQQLQKLLKKVTQGTSACLEGPAPDHQVLAAVVLSRFGGLLHDWPEGYFKAQQSKGNALAGIFTQAMNQHQAQKITRTRSIISRMFSGGSALARLKSLTASAAEVDKPSSSAGRTKSGLASLMQRAVQHAKAEAAAQAAAGTDKVVASTDSGQSRDTQKAPEAPANGKKALAAVLQKAAQKMQDAEAAASSVTPQDDASHDAEIGAQSSPSSTESDALAPDQVQLAMLSPSSSRSAELQPLESDLSAAGYKPPSLETRLVSILQHALSPAQQPSYTHVDADSFPEADAMADESAAQSMPGCRKRSLPRNASLGQKLGSLLKGALSLPRQASFIPFKDDAEDGPSDSSGDSRGSPMSRDPSFHESHGSLSLSGLSGHFPNNAGDVLPHELTLRGSFGSLSLSRDASMALPAEQSLIGFDGANDLPVPMSPAGRRALPRDASYLPEWVNRTLGRGPHLHVDGQSSPRSCFGTTSSNASAESDPGDSNSVPEWVDWPAGPPLSPQHSPQASHMQPAEEDQGDLSPTAPLLLAPPHLRRQQQQPPKAIAALPRAKRPLALAIDPLSLSLRHAPSTNPQLDLRPMAPVASPKGQRLFDFWHQKADQLAPPVQPVASPIADSTAQLEPASAPQDSGMSLEGMQPSMESRLQQAQHAQLAEHTGATQSLVPAPAEAHVHQSDKADSVQSGTTAAAFVAELETASRLVHTQSLQQAHLLEGLERALSQLSEHRLLIQNPQPVAAPGPQQQEQHADRESEEKPEVHPLGGTAHHLLDQPGHGLQLQKPGEDKTELQSASSQSRPGLKAVSNSNILRRRQSFTYADSRLDPPVLPKSGWTLLGRPPGEAAPQQEPSTRGGPAAPSALPGAAAPATAAHAAALATHKPAKGRAPPQAASG
ncbi:TPA: hypothetical protein ACH3X1_007841 [Trebouxia sp. C0004]